MLWAIIIAYLAIGAGFAIYHDAVCWNCKIRTIWDSVLTVSIIAVFWFPLVALSWYWGRD